MATIVHLTTAHPRSDTRIFIKEAQTLAAHLPHKVWLIVADGKGDVNEEQGRVSIQDIGCLGGGRVGRVLIGTWRAFFAIRRLRPAIVHFHDPELIPLGVLLKMIGYKVIYDVHEDVPRDILDKDWILPVFRHPTAWIITLVEWIGANAFDAIVPATPKIAERFPASKTVVIQNFPIAAEQLNHPPIPYVERPKSFVYVGGIATIRGAEEMVRAFHLLADIHGARLDLAGEFSPSSLEDALQALPGWASIKYHGQVSREQVAHLLCGARAGLVLFHPLPNHIVAQPNKLFEYMAAGIPVIASDFPLWRDIIEGASGGLLVNPLDVKAIANAMQWILDHPFEAETIGKNGKEAIRLKYNWQSESKKLLALYKWLNNVRDFRCNKI
jgi:glycosyltransferase involved in cell wall biosynthesis